MRKTVSYRLLVVAFLATIALCQPALGDEGARGTFVQPDEDGYSGPIDRGSGMIAEPSGIQPTDLTAWAKTDLTGEPDQNAEGGARAFSYLHVAGSALRPRNGDVQWQSSGSGGCVYLASMAYEVVNIHANIPEGSTVDYVRIYYYDVSASNSTVWLTTYDDAGSYSDVASASSAGDTGYGTTLSALVGHVVDNTNDSYLLNWRSNVEGGDMALCGIRVAYTLP